MNKRESNGTFTVKDALNRSEDLVYKQFVVKAARDPAFVALFRSLGMTRDDVINTQYLSAVRALRRMDPAREINIAFILGIGRFKLLQMRDAARGTFSSEKVQNMREAVSKAVSVEKLQESQELIGDRLDSSEKETTELLRDFMEKAFIRDELKESVLKVVLRNSTAEDEGKRTGVPAWIIRNETYKLRSYLLRRYSKDELIELINA